METLTPEGERFLRANLKVGIGSSISITPREDGGLDVVATSYGGWVGATSYDGRTAIIASLSIEEAKNFFTLQEILEGEAASRAAQKEQAALDRAAWIESLPEMVSGLTINKARAEIYDGAGNFICQLPKTGSSLAEIEAESISAFDCE